MDTSFSTPAVRWLSVAAFLRQHPGLISRTGLYDAITKGAFPAKKLGGKILIASNALEQLPDARKTVARDGESTVLSVRVS